MASEDEKGFHAILHDDMNFRITNDADAHDVREIYEMLNIAPAISANGLA